MYEPEGHDIMAKTMNETAHPANSVDIPATLSKPRRCHPIGHAGQIVQFFSTKTMEKISEKEPSCFQQRAIAYCTSDF
jgi:hypothetical protein